MCVTTLDTYMYYSESGALIQYQVRYLPPLSQIFLHNLAPRLVYSYPLLKGVEGDPNITIKNVHREYITNSPPRQSNLFLIRLDGNDNSDHAGN
ncbi:hypothetical protein J6590_032904 [Homalodisca vitripennis]|nr:hypothetical protein J6590_032904 [Homalodisca vitripennis]